MRAHAPHRVAHGLLSTSAVRKIARTSSVPIRSTTCYGPIGLSFQACSNLLNLLSFATPVGPGRPMSFMGPKLYISRQIQGLLQVSKTLIPSNLARSNASPGMTSETRVNGDTPVHYQYVM